MSKHTFFSNDNHDNNPQDGVSFNSIHNQKDAEYKRAFDGQDIDNSDKKTINCGNDYSTMTYPGISPLYREKDGVIVFGKGVIVSEPPTPPTPQPNEIWYTTTDGKIVSFEVEDPTFGDGVLMVSNTYNNGQGIITLTGEPTEICDRCFFESNLKSITIPNTVTRIGEESFGSCNGIKSVALPESVSEIGGSAFGGCMSLDEVTMYNVDSIGSMAFDTTPSLKKVTINCETLPNCDGRVFDRSDNLMVYIPAPLVLGARGNNWADLGAYHIRAIKDVRYMITYTSTDYKIVEPNITTNNGTPRIINRNLKQVRILNNVYDDNYYGDGGAIILSDEVYCLNGTVFGNKNNLSTITLPPSVVKVGGGPSGYDGGSTFQMDKNLVEVTIPFKATVPDDEQTDCVLAGSGNKGYGAKWRNRFGGKTFEGCESLRIVNCGAECPPQIVGKPSDTTSVFNGCTDVTIKVPTESVDEYKSYNGWEQLEKNWIKGGYNPNV